VDYDSIPIPDLYVQARRLPAGAMDLWRQVFRDMLPPAPSIRRVLDLGCGTGRFTEMLGDSYHATVVGIDPSLRMLAQRAPPADGTAHFIAAHAEELPLGAGSVDLVFLSMVYHHLRPGHAVAEIARVVSRNGHVFVRNPTRETVPEFEYMRFFPEALAFDLSRMPPRDGLLATFASHGLETAAHRVVRHPFAASSTQYFAKISARAISSLQAIPDEAFARGLAAFERHCRNTPDRPIYEPVEVFLFSAAPR
jgi:ubiquinone/menaquinone biosynthesis C-methylase UbiE